MTLPRLYFDHNATAPLRPEARAAMLSALDCAGNPSSVHHDGRRARALVETAREQVAALVNAKPLEVVFTSGATEANAWVAGGGWDTILASGIEHDSVRGPVAASGAQQISLAVGRCGMVSVAEIARFAFTDLRAAGRTLVMLQFANNETGIIQPVADVAAFARAHGLSLHTDAVQAAGRMPLDFKALDVDTMSLSGHKLGGPAGIGALVIRDGTRLASFLTGGGQERRRRAGTENVIGIAGFGAAAEAASLGLSGLSRLKDLRDELESNILQRTPGAVIIGTGGERLPNTTSVAVPGLTAETLVIKFDLAGVAVSAGAACSSGKVGVSHVLSAMGLAPEVARGAIRLSLGWNTSDADVRTFLDVWNTVVCARLARAVA
jgi:cysteine desulfurase